MSIVLVGSTSGSITLQEPAVAGTTVLTLPAVTGTILTTGSSGQSIPKSALPTGSVLQVVSTTITANLDTTSTSFSDVTGMSLSITPTSATSNILVMCYLNGYASRATDSGNGLSLKFLRGATQIYYSDRAVYGRMGTGGAGDWKITTTNQFSFIDSPATTSSTTYKLQFASLISGSLVGINDYETAQTTKGSGIVLMEIAA